jgi:subtilisin family serine protease
MCDTVAGELLVSFHPEDPAARELINRILERQIDHVSVIEDLSQRLHHEELPLRKLKLRFYRLGVPPGSESFKINFLQFFYKHALFKAFCEDRLNMGAEYFTRSDYQLQIVPHSVLAVRQTPGIGFATTQTHDDYKRLLGWQATPSVTNLKVLVLDTGLDPVSSAQVVGQRNFVDHSSDIDDDHGHGTAVTEIIHDLCPSTEFFIYKVADDTGRASEWDLLAALGVDNGAQVGNISLAFGLDDSVCATCGRESRASRSAVFENLMYELQDDPSGPLLIAAAGNGSANELSFPARFSNVLAIESINKAKELSAFSNRGDLDHQSDPHQNVFVLPGGERQPGAAPSEFVGTSNSGQEFWGTSFAAAYASGLIAALWSEAAHANDTRAQVLDHLRANADQALPNYSSATHGNGLMQLD